MKILFVHQNFPGQYRHVAAALATRPGTEVVALAMHARDTIPGVRLARHAPQGGVTRGVHPLAAEFEPKVMRGESAADAALELRRTGFVPDIICGHPGWGETLFLKDVWPDAPILSYVEFIYRSVGADVNFDPEFPAASDVARRKVRAKNAANLLALADADWIVSPTAWQARQVPQPYWSRTSVIHDGIDTDRVRPDPQASVTLGRDGIRLAAGDEVVTFVSRNLEPYRGFHTFMRALPRIMRERPRAHVLLVGGAGVSYGSAPEGGRSFRDIYMEEVGTMLDAARLHFLGQVPYDGYLKLLQVSAVHVYLTYPFVLSWSFLEAMAAGCAIVGSRTPPVEEVVRDGETAALVDFFSPDAVAEATIGMLANPAAHTAMRTAARMAAVRDYDLTRVCLPRHLRLIEQVAAGDRPISWAPAALAASLPQGPDGGL